MAAPDQYLTMAITSPGPSTLPDQKRAPLKLETRNINSVADIEGAVSSVPYGSRYTNKPQITQDDVQGSRSRPLTREKNVRDVSLFVDDIEGTRHAIRDRMMKTNRHVDPLDPHYTLPSVMPADIPAPKFIRNNLDVNDIDGAKAKPPKKFQVRDTLSTADIVGAQACWKPAFKQARAQSAPHNIMQVPTERELKHSRFQDRSNRRTNPVSPEYLIDGMTIKDDAKYSRPKPLKKFIEGNHLLRTDDIDGAKEGFGKMKREEVRNVMYVGDIEGAQSDTVRSSMRTERETNPLTPMYNSLDGEPMPSLLKPLIPQSFINQPTLRATKGNKEKGRSTPTGNATEAPTTVYSARSFAEAYNSKDDDSSVAMAENASQNPALKLNISAATENQSAQKMSARAASARKAEIDLVKEL